MSIGLAVGTQHGRPGHPEHLGAIALGIEEVTADGAGVVGDDVDLVPLGHEPPVEGAEVVEAPDPQGDLVDQMRIGRGRTAAHERDLVVDGVGIGAEEHGADAPVLLGDPHAEDIAVEGDHPFQVAHVDADMPEPQDCRHGSPPRRCVALPRWPPQNTPNGARPNRDLRPRERTACPAGRRAHNLPRRPIDTAARRNSAAWRGDDHDQDRADAERQCGDRQAGAGRSSASARRSGATPSWASRNSKLPAGSRTPCAASASPPRAGLAITGVRADAAGRAGDGPTFALLGELDGLVVPGHPSPTRRPAPRTPAATTPSSPACSASPSGCWTRRPATTWRDAWRFSPCPPRSTSTSSGA